MPTESLDGRTFRMVSSTASDVDAEHPSVFRYRERDGVIWGDYDGDTVSHGRFVGSRDGDELTVSFAHHRIADDLVVTGSSASTVRDDGERTVLIERFEVDGVQHISICEEV